MYFRGQTKSKSGKRRILRNSPHEEAMVLIDPEEVYHTEEDGVCSYLLATQPQEWSVVGWSPAETRIGQPLSICRFHPNSKKQHRHYCITFVYNMGVFLSWAGHLWFTLHTNQKVRQELPPTMKP